MRRWSKTADTALAMLMPLAFVSCNRLPQPPVIERVDPETGLRGGQTSITIFGEFYVDAYVSEVDRSRSRFNTDFSASLGGLVLTEVTYVDFNELTAVVPAELPLGRHDLTVEDPVKRMGTLPEAFMVLEPQIVEGMPCSNDAGCRDACHSGGACVDGSCAIGAADKDADSDGLVDDTCPGGNDCDDGNPNCSTDCTDTDGDTSCFTHDCDDSGETGLACSTGCSTYYQDADGDGFGNPTASVEACAPPLGFVTNNTDCADTPGDEPACNDLDGAQCNPGMSGFDDCDGADNDCDGSLDEDFLAGPTSCGVGYCASTGSTSCASGTLQDSCTPGAPLTDDDATCDGVDDNCVNGVDDGLPATIPDDNVAGECSGNTKFCDGVHGWVASAGNYTPVGETCDGVDNDCVGGIDDNLSPPACAEPDQGECSGATAARTCQGAAGWTVCSYGGNYEAGDELTCDGLDNDCDGPVDEGSLCAGGWWDAQWLNRLKITFDNTASAEDLTDFPVLVSLNTTNLPSVALSTVVGADIRFRDATTNAELNYEIEAWNAAADTATVWVKVPQIDGSSNTDYIWVYYNYDGVATYDQSAVDEEAVWDDNFKGVWHLDEPMIDEQTGGTHDDSTGVNDGMQRNNAAATGKIAGGQHFDGSDHIDIGAVADDMDVTAGTFSAWVQLDPMNSLGVILSTYPDPNEFIEIRWWEPNDEVSHKYRIPSAHTDVVDSAYDDTSDIWHYATMTWDTTGSELKAYTDGVQVGTTLGMAGPIVIGLSNGTIGARVGNAFGMIGDIDEVRISDTARSADWIEASFLSENGTFAFNTFGSEEAAP